MRKNIKLHILGVGSMGEAILQGLIGSQNYLPSDINISGRDQVKLKGVSEKYGVNAFSSNVEAAAVSDVIILCCKPHELTKVISGLNNSLADNKLVISTLAGISVEQLQKKMKHDFIVRIITNIACSLNFGLTVWFASEKFTERDKKKIKNILTSLGKSVEVSDEKYVELSTPLSGAGPALVALFTESLIDSGVYLGIPRDLSTELIETTIIGGMKLIESERSPAVEVRSRTTSPGGVTAHCIATLEQYGFRTAVLQSILAGRQRTIDLKRDL